MAEYKTQGLTPFTAENRKTRRLKERKKLLNLRKETEQVRSLQKKINTLTRLKESK